MFGKNKAAAVMILTSFLLLLIGTIAISAPFKPEAEKEKSSSVLTSSTNKSKTGAIASAPSAPAKIASTAAEKPVSAPAKSTSTPVVKKAAPTKTKTVAVSKPEPVTKPAAAPTKPSTTTPSRGGQRTLTMLATAYEPGPVSNGKWAGISHLGTPLGYGIVAVDPNVIPLGSRLYIEGYGEGYAADTGGAIKGNRIDLCFNTYEEAMNFGMKNVKVTILE